MSASTIEIELPIGLELPDPALTMSDSYTDGIADLNAEFSVDNEKTVVRVENAFVKAAAPNGEFWRQDSFSVFIAGIRSPRTTAPTLSFKARI